MINNSIFIIRPKIYIAWFLAEPNMGLIGTSRFSMPNSNSLASKAAYGHFWAVEWAWHLAEEHMG